MKQKEPINKRTKPSFFGTRVQALVLFICGFLLYSNTLGHRYAMDDSHVIYNNKWVQAGTAHLWDLATHPLLYGENQQSGDYSVYRPLPLITFALQIAVFGKDPFKAQHIIHVLLYALTIVFVFLLLVRLLRGRQALLPFAITLLYALHPVHTEVVANLKSLDEIYALLFGLVLTLFFLFRYLDNRKKGNLVLSCLFFALGLHSKETAYTFIPVIPITVYFFTKLNWKEVLRLSLPFVVITIGALAIRQICLSGFESTFKLTIMENVLVSAGSVAERYATAFAVLLDYVRLLFVPHPLVWDYSYSETTIVGPGNAAAIASVLLHLGLFVYALRGIREKNIYAYCILFYLFTMSIASNMFVMTASTMGERFLFTPSLAWCIAVVLLLFTLIRKPLVLTAFILGIGIAFSVKAYTRNKDWTDTYSISLADTETAPNSVRTQSTLGAVYLSLAEKQQDPELRKELFTRLIPVCRKITEIYPEHGEAWFNMGIAYYQIGDFNNAEKAFVKQLEMHPADVKVYNNIAGLYYMREDYITAISYFKKYAAAAPTDKRAVSNIGVLYLTNLSRPDSALNYFLQATRIDSTFSEAWAGAGGACQRLKEHQRAIGYFKTAQRHNPGNTNIGVSISQSYLALGDTANAMRYMSFNR